MDIIINYLDTICIKLPQVFGVSRYILAICRGCLLVKNSFVNILEVNRQCLHSLGTHSEDDFEKVSSTSVNPWVRCASGNVFYFYPFSLVLVLGGGQVCVLSKDGNLFKIIFRASAERVQALPINL